MYFYQKSAQVTVEKVAIIAITKNGIEIGRKIRGAFGSWPLYAPEKLDSGDPDVTWFAEPARKKIGELFEHNGGLVCLFSLGAVIRLISPHLRGKKTDPAVIVIDDRANFVISVLSGHLGGANQLTEEIAARLGAVPVITTAADVNKTIAVDLLGREMGWTIDDDSTVTAASAHMVNNEKIAVFQSAGERDWWRGELPKNVEVYDDFETMKNSGAKACLIISDAKISPDILPRSVVYRPKSLVVGIGLHQDTPKETIRGGIEDTFERFGLSTKSIGRLASIKKPSDVAGLAELGDEMNVPVEYVEREELARIEAPNPSDTVRAFEGTPSVSEAAAMLVSGGELIVEKQKFPPNLTVAVARRRN